MEVLDRYLQAVSSWLPKGQQEDLVAELREDLRSEIDEKERQLGRPLLEEETLEIIERRGHPIWVAEAYLPQRHLIGPATLPHYLRALKIAIPCILAVFVVLYLVFSRIVTNAPPALAHPGFWIWQFGLWSFGYVGLFTMIFALVERSQVRARAAGRWDPRDPDGLPGARSDPETRAKRQLRVYAIAQVAGDALILCWWLGVRVPAVPELGIRVAPVWHLLHWPIALFLAASVAVGLANALRPSWSRSRLVARLAVDTCALILAGVLLSTWPWVSVVEPSALPAAAAAAFEKWTNLIGLQVLVVTGAVYTARVIQLARRVSGRAPIRNWAMNLVAGE